MSSKSIKNNIELIKHELVELNWTDLGNSDGFIHLTTSKAAEIIKNKDFFNNETKTLDLSKTVFNVIDEFCFHSFDIKDVILPSSIVVIAKYAFANNDIKNIDFSKNHKLEIIEDFSFAHNKIESFILPKGVLVFTNKVLIGNPCFNNKFKN